MIIDRALGSKLVATDTNHDEWEAIADADPRSLVSHRPAWVGVQQAVSGGTDVSRTYAASDGRRFVLPLVANPLGVWTSFGSGWGFGGSVGEGFDHEVAAAILADLSHLRVRSIRMRPTPIQARTWAEAAGPDVRLMSRRAHVVDLRDGRAAAWKQLSRQCRSGVRSAERSGLEIDHATDGRLVSEFNMLYDHAVERWARERHEPLALARARARHREPIDKWHEISARVEGRCHVWIARRDGVAMAGSVVLVGNDAHETRRAVHRDAASTPNAGRLLAWLALEQSVALGCGEHHLGDSGTSAGLAQFKESFGARPIDYPELRIERFPMTAIDQSARSAVKRLVGFREPDAGRRRS